MPARRLVAFALAWLVASTAARAAARDIDVTPATLDAALSGLLPGDRVRLASGRYDHFTLTGVVGTPAAPIVIEGPADGSAEVHADPGPCCNTVQIDGDVSYVVLRSLTIDGDSVDGAFGVAARGANVHHVTIEGCTFLHHDGSQQHDAISTKTPTSGWVIRGNRILGAGTGMYLGNSTGDDPFVEGVIEDNLIYDTVGYNIEIKWQLPHAAVPGASGGAVSTILRRNVFIKTDRASPDGDRPNLLVGGFPASGADSGDSYQIYGNVFVHNPRESLLQASGRVSIHDNVFFDTPNTAVRLQDHDLPLLRAWVYDNTIVVGGPGIAFGNAAPEGSYVVGNTVLASPQITGPIATNDGNLIDVSANASMYLTMPGTMLGSVDFYPLPGTALGGFIDHAPFATDVDYDRDFNCTPRAPFTLLGAYSGEGTNPGWRLAMEVPPLATACSATPPPLDGGVPTDGGHAPEGGVTFPDGGPRGDASTGGGGSGGCCHAAGARGPVRGAWAIAALIVVAAARRRARRG